MDFDSFISPVNVVRIGREGEAIDPVIREGRIQVFVNSSIFLDAPALPSEASLLALGALFLGGYLNEDNRSRILTQLRTTQGGARVDITLSGVKKIRPVYESLDCLAGKTLLEGAVEPFPLPGENLLDEDMPKEQDGQKGAFQVPVDAVLRGVRSLSEGPSLYRLTGGVHSAGLADRDGGLIHWFEDISRRSAVDKLIGALVKDGSLGGAPGFLVSSGRISSDMITRAVKAKIPLVASVSAPTDRALEIARLWGITVCGFVRGRGMNIYTHPRRILQSEIL